ncbi:MAG: magnesium transporter [Gammaproteobacteria bacterium]|nr:magnesium transporter [Gammaproteobacteria bacterium]
MSQDNNKEHTDRLSELLEALKQGSLDDIRRLLADLHPADIAHLLEGTPLDQRLIAWELVQAPIQGEILLEVSEGVRDDLIEAMDSRAVVDAVRHLDTDEIADLLPDLPDEVVAEILFTLDREDRQRLDTVLSYPEDTAGGLMNLDMVTVRDSVSLEVVLRYLRRRGDLPESTNKLFVVDWNNRLVGSLQLTTLLGSDLKKRVHDVMTQDVVSFQSMTPDRDVAAAFERYNLITAPVVDTENRILGRITVDDVVDVIREQADQAVLARAGLSVENDIFASVSESTKNRALWLGVNLITAFIASWVIGHFETTLSKMVALAVLMPIVASMGGNAGTQTLTLIIRGLALGTITGANAHKVIKKELMVGGLNGIIWALVVALVATLWFDDILLGVIIGVAMIFNMITAALAGVLLPIMLNRLGIDPALAGTVALTTITDVIGFLSFLGLAALFLV